MQPESDRLLLLARDPTGEPVLVGARTRRAGLGGDAASRSLMRPVLSRRWSRMECRSLRSTSGVSMPHRSRSATLLRCRAALAIACDSFGVAEAMLDATVAYAKVRHQFGRPIGSFQGVKFSLRRHARQPAYLPGTAGPRRRRAHLG